jgi:predicted dehydrogenase
MSGAGVAGVGLIGAGNISDQYLGNLTRFPDVDVRFVADLVTDRAAAQAAAYGVAASGTVDELLARDDIEVVLNLTVPAAHTEVSRRIVAAGKHVWSEKPLALDRDDAAAILADAAAAGLRVACAPDTVLGAGLQTAFRAIARGDIGQPLTATTMFHVPGPEAWHPNPAFLYARGAGPLFDIGPYYVTTLVHVLGSASRVQAVSSRSHATRTVASGPLAGEAFDVEVPTHHAALIQFDGGASAQSTFSFQHALPRNGLVEINGTEGTLVLPDPNMFDGESTLWRAGHEPQVLPAEGAEYGRGAGVVDLVRSLRSGTTERASGAVASHVLDVMLAIRDAAESGASVDVASTVDPVAPLPEGWDPTVATLGAVAPA